MSKRIRTCLIDDDPFILSELCSFLETQYAQTIEIVGVFKDALEAKEKLKSISPELVFLDIHMPNLNGFEILDQLEDVTFEVIFITSYSEYAIQAIRYSALDYLLKPINTNELNKSIERFLSIPQNALMQARLENLRYNLKVKDEKALQLVIPTKQGEHHFLVNDIIRCEADSNYTMIYLKSNKKFLASRTLSDIEEMLSESLFQRVHKTHLVQMSYVDRLSSDNLLIMTDKTQIPVSRRRLAEVKAILYKMKID
jgi:two-component system LytT family response regulator